MSRWKKLLQRILSMAADLRFDEIKKVLEHYGYKFRFPKGGSSHGVFRKPGCPPITIPNHDPIKKAYVKMVKNIVIGESEKNRKS